MDKSVDWVRCWVCSRMYVNKDEAILGGCAKWSRPVDQDGVLVESEHPYETLASILKMGRFGKGEAGLGGPEG